MSVLDLYNVSVMRETAVNTIVYFIIGSNMLYWLWEGERMENQRSILQLRDVKERDEEILSCTASKSGG